MDKLLLDRAQLVSWHADVADAHETITHAAPLVFEHGGDALFQQYAASVRRLLSMAQESGVFVGMHNIPLCNACAPEGCSMLKLLK